MSELKERLLPGTSMSYSESNEKAFSRIELLISVAGGLSLSQVCSITGLEGTTIQNWVKRGWVSNPRGKKYSEAQIARILIINALKECLKLESIARLMRYVNGSETDGADGIIKESELFNYLCEALKVLRQADDFSRSGVEAVAQDVIRGYEGPFSDSRHRLYKALSVMIFACVCTDVKRRTESMLDETLSEPDEKASAALETEPAPAEYINTPADTPPPVRHSAENDGFSPPVPNRPDVNSFQESKKTPAVPAPQRSWFFKKGS